MCMKFFRHEHFIDALTQSTSEGNVLSNILVSSIGKFDRSSCFSIEVLT